MKALDSPALTHASQVSTPTLHTVILKVAARCNLDCPYCYVFHGADDGWRSRPSVMSEEVYAATLERIAEHCDASGQDSVGIAFHGGEPTLLGPDAIRLRCEMARNRLEPLVKVRFSLQTNGTLLHSGWHDVLREHKIALGVSVDGPTEVHDINRYDRHGRGSHSRIVDNLAALRQNGIPFGILCVISLGTEPLAIHRHLVGLQPQSISYLMPDVTNDGVAALRQKFGPLPVAEFLLPLLDEWVETAGLGPRVDPFHKMMRLILGGPLTYDDLGNPPLGYLFVETDGEIRGLDVLSVIPGTPSQTGLNVSRSAFCDLQVSSPFHWQVTFEGVPTPSDCSPCPELSTCGGGYLPHRYSAMNGFANRSAWCPDILTMFDRLRHIFDVSPEMTARKRLMLAAVADSGHRTKTGARDA